MTSFLLTLVILVGAAPVETLNGTIRSVDKGTGHLVLTTIRPKGDRTLRIDRETAIKSTADGPDLAVGQLITATVEPKSGMLRSVTVMMSPAPSVGPPLDREFRARHTVLKPGTPSVNRVAANLAYALTVRPARTIDAVLTYELSYPGVSATEWILVAPRAPELPGQMNLQSSLSPGGTPTWDLSPSHRPLLMSRIEAFSRDQSRGLSARVEYRGTLLERHLNPRTTRAKAGDAIPLGSEERRKALARGGLYELDDTRFRRWLSLERLEIGPDESEIDFARRVFLAIKQNFTYEYQETMDRHLSRVCTDRSSDCGGLSLLFAAALRVQGIPARVLAGRWAKSAVPGDRLGGVEYHQWHVKAEFYADGLGWIPADPAAALVFDRSSDGLRYFGHDDGDFLAFHVDPDLLLDSVHFGLQRAPFLNGRPGVWVAGTGSLAGPRVRQTWRVREVGAPPRAGRLADTARSAP